MKKTIILTSILLIPAVFIFLIYIQTKKIIKPVEKYCKTIGKVEAIGITTKIWKGSSYRSFPVPSETSVFFIKLTDNDTLYSYASIMRNYDAIIDKLNRGDDVIIFNEGYDGRQNTVDIIQLEKQNNIIISKKAYNKKEFILLAWFVLLLLSYFYIPYRFIFKERKNSKRISTARNGKKRKNMTIFRKWVSANHPKNKRFAGKAQMPEILCGVFNGTDIIS